MYSNLISAGPTTLSLISFQRMSNFSFLKRKELNLERKFSLNKTLNDPPTKLIQIQKDNKKLLNKQKISPTTTTTT